MSVQTRMMIQTGNTDILQRCHHISTTAPSHAEPVLLVPEFRNTPSKKTNAAISIANRMAKRSGNSTIRLPTGADAWCVCHNAVSHGFSRTELVVRGVGGLPAVSVSLLSPGGLLNNQNMGVK